MRLIDADALEKWIADRVKNYHKSFPDWRKTHPISVETALLELDCIKDVVRGSPTIDAVPVVRCKDCNESEECPVAGIDCLYCGVWDTIVRCNGYCDHGAKMDAKEEES